MLVPVPSLITLRQPGTDMIRMRSCRMKTEDCVFEASRGPDVKGTIFTGQAEVRRGIEEVFATFPDARWNGPKHFIAGDRGISEWVFTATGPDGAHVEVQGCDVFTFRNGKIAVKNSYRKQRTG